MRARGGGGAGPRARGSFLRVREATAKLPRALHESVSPLGPRRWPAGVTQSHIYVSSAPHHFANTLLVTYQTTRGPRLQRQASPLPPIR